MGINVNDITSAEWSLSTRGQGEVEQGFDDINQCIKLIVSTQRGTDPLRPDFGCDLWRFMDYGINTAAARMTNEILSALATWETRIEITNINFSTLEESVTFNILWILQGNKQKGSASLTLDFAPKAQTDAPPVIIAPIDTPVLSAVYTYPDGVLSWTFPSPIGVSFQILRSANGGALEQIDTVFSVLTYTDVSISFDTEFTYQIRAVKGSRVSDFSNAVSIQTLEPYLEFSSSAPVYIDVQKTGTADIVQSAGGISKVYLLDDDPENITDFLADDAGDPDLNAGITGILDLGDTFSGLRTIRARSQDFTLLAGTWVRNASVDIDVSNSIISLDRITALIDNIILANGGTIDDNGVSYTGVPGETHASRLLGIGSLVIDITAPANAILYEKVLALETVGWTISIVETICDKSRNFNTDSQDYIAWTVDNNFAEIISIDYITANALIPAYYDTIANAIAGTGTGLLAAGEATINAYLSNTAWTSGEALRIYNPLGDPLQTATINYKGTPISGVPCGLQLTPYIAGNAKIYDNVFDSDSGNIATLSPNVSLEFGALLYVNSITETQYIFDTRNSANQNGTALVIGVGGKISYLQVSSNLLNRNIFTTDLVAIPQAGYYFLQFTQVSTTTIRIWVNGVEFSVTQVESTGSVNNGSTILIGAIGSDPPVNRFFDGRMRKMQFLNTLQSDAIRAEAAQVGSYEVLTPDAQFLLDVDFNQTGTANLTTRPSTPLVTFTASGGAAYTKFIP